MKVLLTTPDFPPKLGGLSTFSKNIQKTLLSMNVAVDILQWDSLGDLKEKSSFVKLEEYEFILNIHYMGGLFFKSGHKHINFFHGSEILFTSPSFLKRIAKKILKKSHVKFIESAYRNYFISEFTMKKMMQNKLKINYSRDFVFHNCIELDSSNSKYISDIENEELSFTCIARDVPHKNFEGIYSFCYFLSENLNKKIHLYITSERFHSKGNLEVHALNSLTDDKREDLYKRSHFNLLMSLDHSAKGFYEGFGLTVLEAGKYGTPTIGLAHAGLCESIHHNYTGWLLKDLSSEEMSSFLTELTPSKYKEISDNCYSHTLNSHSLENYTKLFEECLK